MPSTEIETPSAAEILEEKNRFSAKEVSDSRSLLLHDVFDLRNDGRIRRREVVRQLMGALTAARQAGYGWEDIAVILAKGGVVLKPNTLKQYFCDLREEATVDDKKEIKEIIDTRRQLSVEDRSTQHEKIISEVRQQRPARSSQPSRRQTPARHPAPQAQPVVESPPPPSSVQDSATLIDPDNPGLGPLLSVLEAQASKVKNPAVLPNDVFLSPDKRVYFDTGEPFNLLLNARQLTLLRTTGHLVASSGSATRTSGQFVKLDERV